MKDLTGDRNIEYQWILNQINKYSGKVLDFGSGPSFKLGYEIVKKGFNTVCIDLLPSRRKRIDNLKYIQGNILDIDFKNEQFDIIVNCSSIEHAGLYGRYGSKDSPDEDIKVMDLMSKLIEESGIMILTIPVGKDHIYKPFHRVYGRERLPKLLEKWKIIKKEFWKKNNNKYQKTNEIAALEEIPGDPKKSSYYALGLYVLKKN